MTAFLAVLRRDLQLGVREGGALGTALGFYLVVIAILPLGLGPDLDLLQRISGGVLWIGLLLSSLLSIDRLFAHDLEDGSLDVLMSGALPLELVVTAKAIAHFLVFGLPLVLFAPLLGLMLNFPLPASGVLVGTMALGAPAVSFVGAIGAALTLPVGRGGLLLALLMLPFFIPILIFGIATLNASLGGPGSAATPALILTALTLAALVLAPFAAAFALRVQFRG
ncbi:MAG: heme exporter protein CcmB [Pseudomonadota bacterium]